MRSLSGFLSPHGFARPGRFGGLLLGVLLAGLAPRLAAQDLVPGDYDMAQENLYARPAGEEYRRLKVRAVLVLRQSIDRNASGRPLVLRPVSYQEFDALGHLTRQYWPDESSFTHRMDLAYGPGDELSEATMYQRLPDPLDTTRLGRVWLPASHTRYPAATSGTGTVAQWDEPTGDWQLSERYRRWQGHDTTYLATTSARTGQLTTLDRSYYTSPNHHLWRQDKLTFHDNELHEVRYDYIRYDNKRIREMGRLDFQQALIDYLIGHPEAAGLTPRTLPATLQDHLARHSVGQLLPFVTQTFDAHGLVRSRTAYDIRTIYERDAHDQLRQSQYYRNEELWQLTRFAYQPNGLLARATAFDRQGQLTNTLVYSYRYY